MLEKYVSIFAVILHCDSVSYEFIRNFGEVLLKDAAKAAVSSVKYNSKGFSITSCKNGSFQDYMTYKLILI